MTFVEKWKRCMNNNMQVENVRALAEDVRDDPAAFGALYNHYVQPIYRYLYSRVGTVHEAEDLTSQTFVAAYESLGRYRERGYFSAWLFRIARGKLIDHFRRARREVRLEAVEGVVRGEDALGQIVQDEEISRLMSLIGTLNPDERDLIRLRYVADLTFAEIADLLGKREGAVKKSLYRLLERLKGEMERQ